MVQCKKNDIQGHQLDQPALAMSFTDSFVGLQHPAGKKYENTKISVPYIF